jgi:hypothetical protein
MEHGRLAYRLRWCSGCHAPLGQPNLLCPWEPIRLVLVRWSNGDEELVHGPNCVRRYDPQRITCELVECVRDPVPVTCTMCGHGPSESIPFLMWLEKKNQLRFTHRVCAEQKLRAVSTEPCVLEFLLECGLTDGYVVIHPSFAGPRIRRSVPGGVPLGLAIECAGANAHACSARLVGGAMERLGDLVHRAPRAILPQNSSSPQDWQCVPASGARLVAGGLPVAQAHDIVWQNGRFACLGVVPYTKVGVHKASTSFVVPRGWMDYGAGTPST